jgi:hypothetical protein
MRLRVIAIIAAALAMTPAGAAARDFQTIVQDDAQFLHRPAAAATASAAELAALGVDRLRVTAGWSVIAPAADSADRPDFDARDPRAYPPGAWDNLDKAVAVARAAGLDVMIDIAFWAPRWATSGDPNPGGGRARWNVDAREYAHFVEAVVTRYSGTFVPPAPDPQAPPREPSKDSDLLGGLFGPRKPQEPQSAPAPMPPSAPLPAVTWWTIWNEPNYPGFLLPQWTKQGDTWVPRSPTLYRRLVQAAYPVIKRVQPMSMVLVGGLAPNGSTTPRSPEDPVPALRFLRELACVDAELQPIVGGDCADYETLPGDGFAHHPYSLYRVPAWRDARRPDNVPVGGLDRLTTTLDALVSAGRVAPALRDIYLTEYGYESNPPDPARPFDPGQQARLLSWAEAIAWRNPSVKSWPQFLLNDMGVVKDRYEFADWQTGLRYFDGSPKPALDAFRLPLHAECQGYWAQKRRRGPKARRRARVGTVPQVVIWGRIRPRLAMQPSLLAAVGTRWVPASTAAQPRGVVSPLLHVDDNGVFQRYAPWRPGLRYRLVVRSLLGEQSGISVEPARCPRGSAYLARGL